MSAKTKKASSPRRFPHKSDSSPKSNTKSSPKSKFTLQSSSNFVPGQIEALRVLGFMSGTSLDGVDAVLCKITPGIEMLARSSGPAVPNHLNRSAASEELGTQIQFLRHESQSFPSPLKKKLRLAAEHKLRVRELFLLHHELGIFYSEMARQFSDAKVQLVGLHGQTVYHEAPRATAQIGEPAYIAHVLDCPVVSDFRVNDLVQGGQGAPLAPFFHVQAFRKAWPAVVVNLGGIANITQIDRAGKIQTAFDTGPANMLIDALIQQSSSGRREFDRDGELSRRGKVDCKALRQLMQHPFFKKNPPKSCGREEFGESFLKMFKAKTPRQGIEDRLATATELTAMSLAEAILHFNPADRADVILCGGGARNSFLRSRIEAHLGSKGSTRLRVTTSLDWGWDPSHIEAAAFAWLAALRWWRIPVDLPRITGGAKPLLLGKITEL